MFILLSENKESESYDKNICYLNFIIVYVLYKKAKHLFVQRVASTA